MENLKIYKMLEIVPKEAQKVITGGRLSGMTDIKPMWRIEKLTETFGPVGLGWYTETTKKEIIEGANGEKIAVVDILLYVNYKEPYQLEEDLWSKPIEGSGGSSFIAKEKNGLYTSDECFKMAYTDALSVACKSLGMGANVYWGDSKYNTTKLIETKEEALDYVMKFGKYKDKTISEILEVDEWYIAEYLLYKCDDPVVQSALNVLGYTKPTEEEAREEIENMEITEAQKQQIREIDKELTKEYLGIVGKSKISELTYKEAYDFIKGVDTGEIGNK